MVKLNNKTADRLAKLFVEVYECRGTKSTVNQLDQTIYQIQQSWIGTN